MKNEQTVESNIGGVNKLSGELYQDIQCTLSNILKASTTIQAIRWVYDFSYFEEENGTKKEQREGAYIISYVDSSSGEDARIVLAEAEIKRKGWLWRRDTMMYRFFKDVLCRERWHLYPVVWGEIHPELDSVNDYSDDGIYGGNDYRQFTKKPRLRVNRKKC